MENKQLAISFVIPALNEEKSIGETVDACFAAIRQPPYNGAVEVVVVDDGSNDATGDVAKAHGAKVVRHPVRAGYGFALKTGIRHATNDTIVITDADGTYPINETARLLSEYALGYDMVVSARTGEAYRQSAYKDFLRTILKFIVEWAAGKKIDDINSGFRVFSKKTISDYTNHLCDTFSFTTSLTLAYMMTNRFVAYLPIDYLPRIGKSHVRLFRDSVRTMSYIILQILYFNPIKIFSLFSVICLAISAIGFTCSALFHINVAYYSGIFAAFSALFIFVFGLLAEQLRQLILTTRKSGK